VRTTFATARKPPDKVRAHARHGAFVARLRRLQRRERPVQRQAQVMRRMRWSFAVSGAWLQIALRTAREASPALPATIVARPTTLLRTTGRVGALRETHVLTRLRQVHAVERAVTTVAHAERQQEATRATRAARAAAPAAHRPGYPRLSLTLARAAAAPASAPAGIDAAADGARTARLQANTITATAQPVPLHPAELSRVTEHVLRTLDRRVLSYRERTGQV
jgi:hypothetical protein